MRTLHKAFAAEAKPAEGGQPGEFTALVSAFGVQDLHGEVVAHGAFTDTLGEWAARGRNIPAIWSHQWADPDSFIGEYVGAEETEDGLLLRGLLDVDDNPRAARVYDLMRKGRVVEFSIGGGVRDWELVERPDADPVLHLTSIDLWEAGPCFKGVNPGTELQSVKAANAAQAEQFGKTLADQFLSALRAAGGEFPTGEDGAAQQTQPGHTKTSSAAPGAAPHVRALLDLTAITDPEGTV